MQTQQMKELVEWYQKRGAPGDQQELRSLLRELCADTGGVLQRDHLAFVAEKLQVKVSFLQAIARRTSGIRLDERHILEMCAGPNCGKHTELLEFAATFEGITVKTVPCMRLCGKGPNLRFDGKLYHKADRALIRSLVEGE